MDARRSPSTNAVKENRVTREKPKAAAAKVAARPPLVEIVKIACKAPMGKVVVIEAVAEMGTTARKNKKKGKKPAYE